MKLKTLIAIACTAFLSTTACAAEPNKDAQASGENKLNGETKTLVAYFSAQGHTQAVAEAIQSETGADIFRIQALVPYKPNPYDDSDRVKEEAFNDLRPEVKEFISEEQMAKYDTIFVGTPCWWHQPAMVVCTFLEHYNLKDKVVIPFVTYDATTYLNETMQKLYRCTPNSVHIPAQLPEDIEPDNIRQPQNDDDGIDMPRATTVKQWLERIGYGKSSTGIKDVAYNNVSDAQAVYTLTGLRLGAVPSNGMYIMNGKKFISAHNE